MLLPELWRNISSYVEKPFRVFCTNKSNYSMRYYGNILVAYLRYEMLGDRGNLTDLYDLFDLYYYRSINSTIISIIEDLASIIDNRYLNELQRCPLSRKYLKKKVNKTWLLQFKRYGTIDLDNHNCEYTLMRVDNIYRLPILLTRKLKKDPNSLQLRALLY